MKPSRRNTMKNLWLNKSNRRRALSSTFGRVLKVGFLFAIMYPFAVQADDIDDALLCLEKANLPCAVEIESKLYGENPTNTDVLLSLIHI